MQVGFGCPHRGGRPVGVAQETLTCVRRGHRPPATGAVQELHACRVLERRDLLADRRLGVAELGARSTERPGLDDGFESGEMADLDTDQSIMFLDHIVHEILFY